MIIFSNIIKFMILSLVTFLFMKVITNSRRLAITGTFLISASTAVVQYINSGLIEVLIFGQLFLIFLNNFFCKDKNRYIYAIGSGLSIIGYLLLSNTSFQIPFAITFLSIGLWVLIKNKEKLKLDKKSIGLIALSVVIATIIGCVFYKYQKIDSVEERIGTSYLMNYTYSAMLPFNKNIKFDDVSSLATMISVFPIVLIIAVWYIFKYEEKHMEFFMPTVISSILQIILLCIGKISYIVPNYILGISIALIQIYMMIYIFSNVEEKVCDLKVASYISVAGIIFIMLVPFPSVISEIKSRVIPYMIFVLESFIVLNYTDKRFWKLASWVFTFMTIFETIGWICVNFV